MDNQETITKLSEALNTLIAAYEDLQLENMSLKSDIDQLNDEKSELETKITDLSDKKSSLENNIDNLNVNNEKQNTNIHSMLGKINSLLSDDLEVSNTLVKTEKNHEETITSVETEEITKNIFDTTDESEEEKKNDTNVALNNNNNYSNKNNSNNQNEDGKLDLNRMASLLNGFK
ncbi:MAG: hypothetical protein HRT40_04645 [Campylobacteraceae bacterium]|nr:hypothetical protein [Campylobacteraceae bacterium]